jgi:Predicted acyltransferases
VAAAIVLLHHLSMTVPAVSNGYDSASNLVPFSFAWWAVASPLKVFFAGPEFVLVFFALSGFVLTLSPIANRLGTVRAEGLVARGYDWVSYYPRRIIRLGVPVAASMLLAFTVIRMLPHPAKSSDGSWLTRQAHPDTSVHNLITETLLIVDPNHPSVNPPLWSLTWEMWFSLLLPVGVLIALWSRRVPVLWALLFVGVSGFGYIARLDAASFMPAFALGALLGANAHRINAFVTRWQSHRGATWIWIGVTVSAVMALISYWLFRPVLGPIGNDITMGLRVPGAVLLVATAAFWPAAARLFTLRPIAWLGTISFSLYLVHSPIVVALGLIFTGQYWWVGASLSLAASFGLAVLMYHFVEKPSTRLASWAGKHVSAAVASITGPIEIALALEEHRHAAQSRREQVHTIAGTAPHPEPAAHPEPALTTG